MNDLKTCPYELCFEPAEHGHGTDYRYLSRMAKRVPESPRTAPRLDDASRERLAATTAPTKQRQGDQVLPKPGVVCVQDLVIARMEESKRVGMERYGSTLQTFNGRKGIQDVAEEVRDLFVYITQIEEEAKADRDLLIQVVEEEFATDDTNDSMGLGVRTMLAERAVDAIMGWVVGQRAGESS